MTAGNGARLRAFFEGAGAEWLDLPVLHPVDPFLETAGEDIRRRMFVTEGPAGERLCLRPDFTIPVCLHHLSRGGGPGRYAYGGTVFRRTATGAAERPETGCEDIGSEARAAADARMISLACEGARMLGADAVEARLGDIGIFTALLSQLGLPEPWRRRLRRSFGAPDLMEANLRRLSAPREATENLPDAAISTAAEAEDRAALVALIEERLRSQGHTPGLGRSAAEIADRTLDKLALARTRLEPETLRVLRAYLALAMPLDAAADALRRFSADAGIVLGAALDIFSARADALLARADASVRFEAAFGRPLEYYTGLVFELTQGDAAPLAGGGRYDRLLEMLGARAPIPAVGFAIRLDRAGDDR